jgi:hypothetical protein
MHLYEILSEFNFYVRVRTYEKRVTGMQPLRWKIRFVKEIIILETHSNRVFQRKFIVLNRIYTEITLLLSSCAKRLRDARAGIKAPGYKAA